MHVDLAIAKMHAKRVLDLSKKLEGLDFSAEVLSRRVKVRCDQAIAAEYLAKAILRYIADTEAK